MNPNDAFGRILASLQQTALDDAHWTVTAGLIDELLGTRGSALVVGKGHAGGQGRIYLARFCSHGERREDQERTYFQDYYRRDERLPRLAVSPHGRLASIGELYTPPELKTSAAWNEGLPQLGYQHGLNVRLDLPDTASIVWTLADTTERGGWRAEQVELIDRLLPHLHHVVVTRQALAAVDALGNTLTGLLDNTRIGVLHLDRSGRLLAANDPAQAILRLGDGLSDQDGALHAWLPEDDERLQRLLRGALPEPFEAFPAGGSTTLKRPSGGPALGLHVRPVGDWQADFGGPRVAALLLAADPLMAPRIDPQRVSEALGLTPAQGRVAALLAEGMTVRGICAATGYREHYVRTLIKRVYERQGVSNQVALVLRILALEVLPPK